MSSELSQKLYQFRLKSPLLPKQGKPPKTNALGFSKLTEKLMAFALLLSFSTFLYLDWRDYKIFYVLHFCFQIFIVLTGLVAAKEFLKYFLTFRFVKAFHHLGFESTVIEKMGLSIAFAYGLFYLASFLTPYVDNLIDKIRGSFVSPETYEFNIWVGQYFYLTWIALSILIFVSIFIFRSLYNYFENSYVSSFRLWLGKSTGELAKLSHGRGLAPKQNIAISFEDAAKNIVIMGGIGEGKTTRAVYPILLQLVQQDCGGFIFDIKSDFKQAVKSAFREASKESSLLVIGENNKHINLIEGLTPQVAASFLKSSLMLNGSSMDSFWLDTASQLCTNILGILSLIPKQYNLASLHDYIFDSQFRSEINAEIDILIHTLDANATRHLNAYRNYYEKNFLSFDEKVQTGVKASISQILQPFVNPTMTDLFCRHSDVRIQDVLDGMTILVDLPLSKWGMGGKVAYNMLKLRFFNLMQSRVNSEELNQNRRNYPVFFMCDEYQEIVSGSKDGHSDLNFWDKSRSSGTIGIVSAQSISSFYAAIGNRDIANAVLQNFRQKIFFKTEDETTIAYLHRLTGNVDVERRSTSKQTGSSFGSRDMSSNKHRSKTESVTWVTKPVIDPQLIRTLNPKQAIAILSIQGHSCDDVINTLQVTV